MAEGKADENDAAGHRARLRKRLLEGGAEALADHEVIEFLLMGARPRIDTKPIARDLLKRYGSLAGVLNADPQALAAHAQMGEASAAALKIVALAARRLARSEVQEKPVLGSWQALTDYLHVAMAHRMNESARVLHLNSRNMLIRDELISDGSVDQAVVYVREVARRALELGSAAIILVHNHPTWAFGSHSITLYHAETKHLLDLS